MRNTKAGIALILGIGAGLAICSLHQHNPFFCASLILFFSILVFLLLAKICSLKKSLLEAEKNAMIDYLTGLFNRRYLEKVLKRELKRAERERYNVGVVIVDIDHFKKINDRHGHEGGDRVLIEFASILKKEFRLEDIYGRWGGEEFLLILPKIFVKDIIKRLEEFRTALRDKLKIEYKGRVIEGVTVSFGVAVYPESGETDEILIYIADSALYRAKKEGRDRIVVM